MTPDWRPVVRPGFTLAHWDGSHDWVVVRTYRDLRRVTIRFRSAVPTGPELIALRRCVPRFRDLPPGELRASIQGSGTLPLGEMESREAYDLVPELKAAGLVVDVEGASRVLHHFEDRTTGEAWVIEDPAEAWAVAEAMLAAGVPLQPIEA